MFMFNFNICTSLIFSAFSYEQFSVENYALVDHEHKQLRNAKFKNCVKACEKERACISVNFGGSLEGVGCCTLNDCGVEGEENKGKFLIFTPGCFYHQVRPSEAAISKVYMIMSLQSYFCTLKAALSCSVKDILDQTLAVI